MRRRQFITGLGSTVAWPVVARAQQGERVRRIGVLVPFDENDPALGAICLSSSSHFPLMLYSNAKNPVALPPGRAKLSTRPPPTGSAAYVNTIGT
jgi:hypothetical protein